MKPNFQGPLLACMVALILPGPFGGQARADPVAGAPDGLRLAPGEVVEIGKLPWHADAFTMAQADQLLVRGRASEALALLAEAGSPSGRLLRARSLRLVGQAESAVAELEALGTVNSVLTPFVALERGLAQLDLGNTAAAVALLGPLVDGRAGIARAVASQAVLPLAQALVIGQPGALVELARVLEGLLPGRDPDARSLFLEFEATALEKLGRLDAAALKRRQRFLEEPVSSETPERPPAGVRVSAEDSLARAQVLLEQHRNARALEALAAISERDLNEEQRCARRFGLGVAARKLHHYKEAETHLAHVVERCRDLDLARRAAYVRAKVVSIVDGLRAVEHIETFAERFSGHTMVDDVLFWAGDMYQRRRRFAMAEGYYERIATLPNQHDYCGPARWRLAWMAFRQGELDKATERLASILRSRECPPGHVERARAAYWRARIAAEQDRRDEAVAGFKHAMQYAPVSYYAQLALSRLYELDRSEAERMTERMTAPRASSLRLCPGVLAEKPAFRLGLALLVRGLASAAATEFTSIKLASPEGAFPFANFHAASGEPSNGRIPGKCTAGQGHLLLALLLDAAGAHREALLGIRHHFRRYLRRLPRADTVAIWHAAYPLAERDVVGAAEHEQALPELLLQALAREESAFDAQAVSWAGAYGLTQLLPSTARRVARQLDPPIRLTGGEELLDPRLNARLGGALMAGLLKRFKGHPGLALAAYNAGERAAEAWWRRHAGGPFDVWGEEISIKETRAYVQRVLETFGVYRWLHVGQPPRLPVPATLPPR